MAVESTLAKNSSPRIFTTYSTLRPRTKLALGMLINCKRCWNLSRYPCNTARPEDTLYGVLANFSPYVRITSGGSLLWLVCLFVPALFTEYYYWATYWKSSGVYPLRRFIAVSLQRESHWEKDRFGTPISSGAVSWRSAARARRKSDMSRGRNAGVLLLLAWSLCAQAYAFRPANKCFQTHPTTHRRGPTRRAAAIYHAAPLNRTPLNFTALNITPSDCVEVARPPPSRGPICTMMGPADGVPMPAAEHVENLVGAFVAWQCSFDIYDRVRCANDIEVALYRENLNSEVEQYVIMCCGGLGYSYGPITLGREQPSSTVRAWVSTDVRTALLQASIDADQLTSLEFCAAFLFPLNSCSGFVPFPPEFFAALFLFPLNGCSGAVPFPPWNMVVTEHSQALSVAFPTTFPYAVALAATSRVVWCTCWETRRTTEIKRAKKLCATGNSQDAKEANAIIRKCTDENVGRNRAICTIADVSLAVIACATPLEWAHLPFYPSYELGLPTSPFEQSIALELVAYSYLVKLDYEGDYGSGRPDDEAMSRDATVPRSARKRDAKRTTDV